MFKIRQARMPAQRRTRRAALMATTALLALGCTPALAQTVVDGGAVENVPGTQGSPWNLPGLLIVGDTGAGTLNIGVGGTPGVVSSALGTVGNNAGSNGTVTITGAGSSWTVGANPFVVGGSGTGALSVTGGGLLDTGNSLIGFDTQGNGTVTITGAGSVWTTTQLTVGSLGTGTLVISAGALVGTSSATVGDFSGSHGTLTVTGMTGLQVVGALAIGAAGSGTASFLARASVTSDGGTIGGAASGVGQLIVDGNGTSWLNSGGLLVGNSGNGTMSITGGGLVTDTNALLGSAQSGVGTVTVTGLGSSWVSLGGLTIGVSGKGFVTVSDKGSVLADFVSLGMMTGGEGTLLVTGLGTAMTSTNTLTVADLGRATLTIADSAVMITGDAIVAQSTNSTGSIDVTGAGSKFFNHGNLAVGVGGDGALRITDGASVQTLGAGFVGYMPGSSGYARVAGAGSIWNTGSDIYVGGDSGNAGIGQMTIADGGQVVVNNGTGMVALGVAPGSAGILTIGGEVSNPGGSNPPAAPGSLDAALVHLGNQTGWLRFNHTSDNYVFAPVITGNGSVDHYAGTTHLTADSSGFTGSVGIGGGRLVVDGKLGGSIFLQSDGILSGTGTIHNLTVYNGGTLAPGNSIGTLNVSGSVIFDKTSVYQVEVNAAGQSDKLAIADEALISGGTVQVIAGTGSYGPTTTYTILSATNGRTGTFDGVASNFAFLSPSLSYDPNNVYLTLTRKAVNFASVGATPNQKAAGAGVGSLTFGNTIYDAVLFLSEAQARGAFDRLSGEIHASAKTVLVEDSRQVRDSAIGRLRAAFADVGAASMPVMAYDATAGGFAAAAPTVERLALWGAGFGAWGRTNGNGNAARVDRSSGGFVIGGDAPVLDNARLGVLGGYSRSSFSADTRASSGTSDNYHVGLYGGAQWNAIALRGGVAYTWHDISSHRTVDFLGFSNSLDGSSRAGTAQVFGELGYGLRAGRFAFEPFANLAHVSLRSDGVTESGGAAALTAQGSRTDTTFSTLGLRAAHDVWVGGVTGTVRATLGWRHAFGDTTPTSILAFAGGGPFTIAGVPISRDAALVEGGLDLMLSPTAVLGLTYGGQFATGAVDQTLRAELNMKF